MGSSPSGAFGSAESRHSFACSPDFEILVSPDGTLLDVNPIAAEVLGASREELSGQQLAAFLRNPEATAVLREREGGKNCLLELKFDQGEGIYLLGQTSPAGESRLLLSARRVARRKQARSVSEIDLDRFRIAFEATTVGIGLVDLEGNFFEANAPLANLFGYSRQELTQMNLLQVWAPEERADAYADLEAVARGAKAEAIFERRYLNKRGEVMFAEVSRGMGRDENGKPLYFVVSFRDITESKRLQGLLAQQAFTDPLTGAMNRHGIEDRVKYEFSRSDRYGDKLTLVMMDLDHFKVVNDTYGHMAGDRVLRAFCDIARSCLRSTDMLGRWGGEEFVALLPETGLDGAELFCGRLRSTLSTFPFDRGIQVRVSMGVVARRAGEEFATLVGRADGCLYRAKRTGRDRVIVDTQDRERENPQSTKSRRAAELHWKSVHRSGQSQLDAEHQESFRLANLLIASVADNGSAAEMIPVVRELVGHMEEHFTHEEDLLQVSGYPEFASHAEAHGRLLERARELMACLESGQGAAAELVGFLIYDLVARHFLLEDRKFFPWLKARPSWGGRPEAL